MFPPFFGSISQRIQISCVVGAITYLLIFSFTMISNTVIKMPKKDIVRKMTTLKKKISTAFPKMGRGRSWSPRVGGRRIGDDTSSHTSSADSRSPEWDARKLGNFKADDNGHGRKKRSNRRERSNRRMNFTTQSFDSALSNKRTTTIP